MFLHPQFSPCIPSYVHSPINTNTYKDDTFHRLSSLHALGTEQHIQMKHFGSLCFISPQTLAPRSWSVGPSRTTGIFLAPCPSLCLVTWTSACPPSLRTLPFPHAMPLLHPLSISPGATRARSHVCEMICLWRTLVKKWTFDLKDLCKCS